MNESDHGDLAAIMAMLCLAGFPVLVFMDNAGWVDLPMWGVFSPLALFLLAIVVFVLDTSFKDER